MNIHYLPYSKIDKIAWDNTIANSPSCLPYAYSWYLDASTKHQWDALISENHELVMPLPFNTKIFGYKQIFQPLLTQQLGVFGGEVSEAIILDFIRSIPKDFRRISLAAPPILSRIPATNDGSFSTKKNLILSLNAPYPSLRTAYNKGHKSRTNKAKKQNSIIESRDIEGFIRFTKAQLFDKIGLPEASWNTMEEILRTIFKKATTLILINLDKNNQPTAQSFFIIERRRIINLFSAISDEGRKTHGTHHILDYLIERFSGQDMFLDFEGSNIEGIYKFFKGFGAVEDNYMLYEVNKLPWWIKQLIKWREK